MKIFCTHCGSQDHSITSCPKLKISHGTPRPKTKTDQLYLYRLAVVRKYLSNPAPWPDSLDWPAWKQPHELWYTGHEAEWAQAVKDNPDPDAEEPPKPRRRPMGLLTTTAITTAPSQRIRSVTAPKTVPIAPATELPANPVASPLHATQLPPATKSNSVAPPLPPEKATPSRPGPKTSGKALSSTERSKLRRQRLRKKP